MQIRKAFRQYGHILKGIIEADETYVGGKNKNRHSNKKVKGCQGRGGKDKTIVLGVLERDGKVIAKKAKNTQGRTLKSFIKEHVEKGATVMTDEWPAYNTINKEFIHKMINHKEGKYVDGDIYTNTIEGFWTLFKRGFIGQYHQLSVRHIDKYLDEFCFRYNNRKVENLFEIVLERGLS